MRHWAPAQTDSPLPFPPQRDGIDARPAGAAKDRDSALAANDGLVLAGLLCLAFALRLMAISGAGFAHQDELFQYFEAAHRIAFGPGVVPWEYRYGMRSWLLPLLLAGPMRLGETIAPDAMLYLILPRLFLTTLSLGIVAGAWSLGRRIAPLHGLIAGAVAAIWPELIHVAPHALTEPIAVALIVPAAALLDSDRPRRLVLAGLLFGIAGLMRFHYLPAIATLVLVATARRRATWAPIVAGGAIALVCGVLVDLAMGAAPFGWLVASVRENLVHGRAAHYGVAGPFAYFAVADTIWAAWAVPIAGLALIGARRRPALLAAALVNLVVHAGIAHKEYRFVLLTGALIVILAAIGTAEAIGWARRRFAETKLADARLVPMALGLWGIAAASLAASGRPASFDTPAGPAQALFGDLRHDRGLCGLATSGISFADAGGYTLLHRSVPMFAFDAGEKAALAADAGAFNRIVAPVGAAVPHGFRGAVCRSGASGFAAACIYTRTGPCTGTPRGRDINSVLTRIDQ